MAKLSQTWIPLQTRLSVGLGILGVARRAGILVALFRALRFGLD